MKYDVLLTTIDDVVPTGATLTASCNGELVASLGLKLLGPSAFINFLYVRSDIRGQGVGTELLRTAIAVAHGQGKTAILLSCADKNEGAVRLYKSMGFVPHALGLAGYKHYIKVFLNQPE